MRHIRLTDHEAALLDALSDVVEQCRVVIDANANRAANFRTLTLNEAQEVAILRVRLDDLAELQLGRRAEAS